MAGALSINYLRKYRRIAAWAGTPIRTAVETGTYQGNSTCILAKVFAVVHTIELSDKWYDFSAKKLSRYKNVVCHHGDSAEILAQLAPSLFGPTMFFFDAHFAGGDTAFGKDEVPLLRELEVISERPYRDVIIIDDLRLIGKTGQSGSEDSTEYPLTIFDWRDVTLERIATIVNHDNHTQWLFENDRVVIFRNLSRPRALILKILLVVYPGPAAARAFKYVQRCWKLVQ